MADIQILGPIAPMVMQIPAFIVNLMKLIRGETPTKKSLEEDAQDILKEITSRMAQYAEVHFQLKDWKLMHEILHIVWIDIGNVSEFSVFLNPSQSVSSVSDVDWSGSNRAWTNFRQINLTRLYQYYSDIKYIPEFRLELPYEDVKGNTSEIEVFSKI